MKKTIIIFTGQIEVSVGYLQDALDALNGGSPVEIDLNGYIFDVTHIHANEDDSNDQQPPITPTTMQNDQFTEGEYYELVCGELKRLGFTTRPHRDTVRCDYEDDKSPEESAKEFADSWE